MARGLTSAELGIGWGLYGSVIGVNQAVGGPAKPAPINTAQQAMNELDAWDAPNFSTSKAVMSSRTPNAMTFLFSQLSAAEGPAAVVAVKTFLNRRDVLKSGDAPGVSAEEGQRAVQLLAERVIVDDAKASELRALIAAAEGGATPVVTSDPVPQVDEHTFQLYRAWLHE